MNAQHYPIGGTLRRAAGAAWALVLGASTLAAAELSLPIAPGPFQGTRDSLTNYTCPDWFRDAKFGIWAHWGPQAVPMEGDWYARKMYEQGDPDYQDHLKRFGHPSTNGWKDIIPLWKAEKWDPERLMGLYKKAGARYFVSMGVHHDDFFLWNSKLHRWNSVNMGPKRDVVGEWQAAARKQGLPFGVSEHLGASFTWFQSAHRADTNGPFAGVPYDGANSNYWDLYHFPAQPGDNQWYSKDPRWQQQWYNEIQELVDNYRPDLLYSDGGVAFENEVGLSQIANLYNLSAQGHDGRATAVYNCKEPSGGRWVQDYERGVNGGINPYPWQTDTSIGDWFYNRHWKYQPVRWTVHMLADIVSKNGNLLLNVVLRPDGSLDPEVETMLGDLAQWTEVNGEAIYGTRPWQVYGEGPVRVKGGAFKENFQYSAKDIRFTTRGATLYAIALGWPEGGRFRIQSLASTADPARNRVEEVELLGHEGPLAFTQTTNGLTVQLPAKPVSDLACSLRITGSGLAPVPVAAESEAPKVVMPDAFGRLVFSADKAVLHGDNVQLEEKGGIPNIGYWDRSEDWVSWTGQAKPGVYRVTVESGTIHGRPDFVIELGGQTIEVRPPSTGDWTVFNLFSAGKLTLPDGRPFELKVRSKSAESWQGINLRSVQLIPDQP
ncbi:MAG: alpha-L-fucosidase [Verrucomicrobiota bacterium]